MEISKLANQHCMPSILLRLKSVLLKSERWHVPPLLEVLQRMLLSSILTETSQNYQYMSTFIWQIVILKEARLKLYSTLKHLEIRPQNEWETGVRLKS